MADAKPTPDSPAKASPTPAADAKPPNGKATAGNGEPGTEGVGDKIVLALAHATRFVHSVLKDADALQILAALVALSLLLHVPVYYSLYSSADPYPLVAASSALGLPLVPKGKSAERPVTVQPVVARKEGKFGDPNDDLLGEPFNDESDYVCDTTFKGVRILNRDPLMAYIDGFLRKGEPEWLINLGRPLLDRSTVVNVDEQPRESQNVSDYRTSSTAYLPRSGDRILRCIEERAVAFSGVPLQNTEGLQITYYREGQYYQPHYDYFPREFASMADQLARGGQRVTTLFAYLNSVPLPPGTDDSNKVDYVPAGQDRQFKPLIGAGSTQFPNLGVEVFPKKGAAAFWWDVDLDGQDDPRTLHAGTAPIYGEKWGLNIWQREGVFT